MDPRDWTCVQVERGRYFNTEGAITGYQRIDGHGGTALHPACVFEDRLRETLKELRKAYPRVHVSRHHVKMPYWDRDDPLLPQNYPLVAAPERLTTTSITVVLVPQHQINDVEMGFFFAGATLPTLRERLTGVPFRGLAGNLGYFMTPGLIQTKFPWSHNVRYPDFPLAPIRSYIGFHLFRDQATGETYSSFQGAHPAAVGITQDQRVEIIPRLEVTKYRVTLWGETFDVASINEPAAPDKVMLFTPAYWSPEIDAHVENWETVAPEIPLPQRINLFIANEGNGWVPVEKVVKVWKGRAPLPSFGAVLSFDSAYFKERFVKPSSFRFLDHRLRIEPLEGTDLAGYVQIMGGFVPVVANGQHFYCVETFDQARQRLRDHGNATSPIAQCGRESRNFDLRIREPAGVFVQTADQIGWVLFDGRHELSIGASVIDVAQILKILQDDGVFQGKIRHAFFVDGGSAMKVYHIESDGTEIVLEPLNRIAPGSRNGPGADPDGLNLYTLLQLRL